MRADSKSSSRASRIALCTSHASVFDIYSKSTNTMPVSHGRLTHRNDDVKTSARPIWGSSGHVRRTSQQRSAVILPHHANKSQAGAAVRRSRSVTPVRQHYQYGGNSRNADLVSTKQQVQRFNQQHQKLHKSLAKTSVEKRGNRPGNRTRQPEIDSNMRLSLRASGSDTMLQKHIMPNNSHVNASTKIYYNSTLPVFATSRPRSHMPKPFSSAVIGAKTIPPADHFRDRSSSETDDNGKRPSQYRQVQKNAEYTPGVLERRGNSLHMQRFSNEVFEDRGQGAGGGDLGLPADLNNLRPQLRPDFAAKDRAAALATAEADGHGRSLADDGVPYCTCSDAEDNSQVQQQRLTNEPPLADQNRFTQLDQQHRPTVNFSTAPPTHYVYTPNQTLNSTMNGTVLESHARSSPEFNSLQQHADRFTANSNTANVRTEQQKLPSNFDDRHMKQAEFDALQRLSEAASTREEVVMLRTQLYDLLKRLAGMNALSNDFASTLLASAGGAEATKSHQQQMMPSSPIMPHAANQILNDGGDNSFVNGASTSTATYMSIERELQRLRCLIDIKDQQLERQQNTLDRRQLVSTQTTEQYEQMEKRMQQLERNFNQQQQTLQQTYQTHLLELERGNAELHRQLQAAAAAAASPNHDVKNLNRETERLRYEYSQLRLEYDAEVRTARDEQQKLRLQLNDMRHQVEQHSTHNEEREKEWHRERKQLESDRDALVEKLNQRTKQLSQLWSDHRQLQEQFKDSANLCESLQRDKLRLQEEAKLLVEDARHFQREAADSVQQSEKERTNNKQAVQDAINSERQRNSERYEAQIRTLEETVREQKRFIEHMQQRIPVPENGNQSADAAAADVLLKQQKSSREKLRKALLGGSKSVSETDTEEFSDRRSPKSVRRRRRHLGEGIRGKRSQSTNDMPIQHDEHAAAAWQQQQLQQQHAQTEYFRQQYEQLRVSFDQRLAVHDSLRVALDEKTQETYGLLSELNRLKRHARDADETHVLTQRRMDDEMRHLRKILDELRTKYANKLDLCEQLKANIAQLHQRLGAAEQETLLKLDEQKREFEQRYADMQKQLSDAANELSQARAMLDDQKQQAQAQEVVQKKRVDEETNDAAAKQHRFSLRLAEQLQQMEGRLAQAENKAGEWQQKLMNVQAAYEQVFGN